MAVKCPASGCDYSGTLDAVEGHIGGVRDSLHEGIVASDLVKSLHGEGSDGASEGASLSPWWVLVAGLLLVGVLLWMGSRDQDDRADQEDEQDQPAESGLMGGDWDA